LTHFWVISFTPFIEDVFSPLLPDKRLSAVLPSNPLLDLYFHQIYQ